MFGVGLASLASRRAERFGGWRFGAAWRSSLTEGTVQSFQQISSDFIILIRKTWKNMENMQLAKGTCAAWSTWLNSPVALSKSRYG